MHVSHLIRHTTLFQRPSKVHNFETTLLQRPSKAHNFETMLFQRPSKVHNFETMLFQRPSKVHNVETTLYIYIYLILSFTDDEVYMDDDDKIKEYLLRQRGLIYRGTGYRPVPLKWYFGQVKMLSPNTKPISI